jgi:hypothetical protein
MDHSDLDTDNNGFMSQTYVYLFQLYNVTGDSKKTSPAQNFLTKLNFGRLVSCGGSEGRFELS